MQGQRLRLLVAAAAVLALALSAVAPRAAAAAQTRAGFVETIVATGLAEPTAMAFAPDGRLFVCQQGGRLRVIKDGELLPSPFLTVTVSASGERGLLGVAFDPDFDANQYVYVYYTATTPTVHNRVSRFTASGDVAVPGSEVVLLDLNPLTSATNHNGGALHFGPDGKLYVGVGENATASNAQTLANLLGKMLRINSDGSIPPDNPFFGLASGVNRAIWAIGLRNPYTFAIEPLSGRMMINDVGAGSWEEINEGFAGANYGWPATEGPTSDPRFVGPLHAYPHSMGCAISGGAFYPVQPSQYPADYGGDYFFADFCAGWIRQYDFATGLVAGDFVSGLVSPVDLAIGPDGSLYYLARGSGSATGIVGRIEFAGHEHPIITQHPAHVTVAAGQSATFRVTAAGREPLFYQWERDGVDIPGATSATYALPATTPGDDGAQFRCRVFNSAGQTLSRAATLTVNVGRRPVPTILSPSISALYVAGTVVSYSGSANDLEDGRLPASRFTWEVVFHHDDHTHPFLPARSGEMRGSFTVPNEGQTSANVWYRIHLTVTDSDGQRSTTFRDVRPRTTDIRLASSPAGLTVTLDGQPVATPHTVRSVVGMRRSIGVVTRQTLNGSSYEFHSWLNGGTPSRTIATPVRPASFTAVFRRVRAREDVPVRPTGRTAVGRVASIRGAGGAARAASRAGDVAPCLAQQRPAALERQSLECFFVREPLQAAPSLGAARVVGGHHEVVDQERLSLQRERQLAGARDHGAANAGFLLGLAQGGLLQRLVLFDVTLRKHPVSRVPLRRDEQHLRHAVT